MDAGANTVAFNSGISRICLFTNLEKAEPALGHAFMDFDFSVDDLQKPRAGMEISRSDQI